MDALKQELEAVGLKTSGGLDTSPFDDEPISIDTFNNYKLD